MELIDIEDMICLRSQGLGCSSNSDNLGCAAFFYITPYFKQDILLCVLYP